MFPLAPLKNAELGRSNLSHGIRLWYFYAPDPSWRVASSSNRRIKPETESPSALARLRRAFTVDNRKRVVVGWSLMSFLSHGLGITYTSMRPIRACQQSLGELPKQPRNPLQDSDKQSERHSERRQQERDGERCPDEHGELVQLGPTILEFCQRFTSGHLLMIELGPKSFILFALSFLFGHSISNVFLMATFRNP